MGRPPSKPKRFKDGFYIEVRNKGADSGMKIWSENREEMNVMADLYRQSKDVVILGEHKKDRWVEIDPAPKQRGRKPLNPKPVVAEDADEVDELIGDIELEELEEAADDKKPKKSKDKAPKEPKVKATSAKKEKTAAKPKAKASAPKRAKAAAKPKAAAKAKPKPKAKPASKPKATKKKKR